MSLFYRSIAGLLFTFLVLCGSVAAHEGEYGRALFPAKMTDGAYPRHYRPDRTVDFEHLKLEIKILMDQQSVEGTVHYQLQPIHGNVTSIRLDAYEMTIKEVKSSLPDKLDWTYSDNSIYINFDKPLAMNEIINLSVSYEANVLNVGGRFGGGMFFTNGKQVAPETADQMYTLSEPFGASSWFPCGDYPNDRMTTEVFVSVPKEFVTLSNGLMIDSKTEDGWRTDHWKQKIPHVTYLISLVVGHFDIVRDEWRGKPVEYYVAKGKAEDARPSMGMTPDMIEFFSNYLDYPYPYEKYAQSSVRYFHAGGMEHTTATTMHEWIVMDANARQDNDMEGLIMHELAHQWFGDLVTCQSWPELWLNEGFATLSDALWDEHTKGEDAYLEAMMNKMSSYFGEARRYTRPVVSNKFEDPGEMFDSHSYPKGASVLHILRHQLGDDLFRKSLNHYLNQNAPGLVDSDDLMESFETVTGRSMDRFFEQWVYGPGHPVMKIEHQWLPESKQVKLTLKQTQKMQEGKTAFAFPLEIEIRTENETIEKKIEITKKDESVFIDCPEAPKSVNLNHRLRALMEQEHEKSQDMLLYDLENGSTMIIRTRAIKKLTDRRNKTVREALLKTAKNDPYLRVRLEAIAVLGKERDDQTKKDLLSLLKDNEPKVRGKVVNSLRGFYKDKEVINALIDIIKNDHSNSVASSAVRTLAHLKPEKVYSVLKSGLQRNSWRHQMQSSILNTLVDLKEPKVFGDLEKFAKDPYNRDLRTTAIRGLGRLAGETKKNQSRALNLLLDYLKSSSPSIRSAAVSGLQSLDREDAISQLQWIESNDSKENIRNAAKRAISEIRRDRESDLAGKNAGLIDKLQDKNKALEDQLKEFESKLDKMNKDINKNNERINENEKPDSK